jgi:transcription termination factor Rho
MYNIEELDLKLLSELREIAEKLEVPNFKKLSKGELVYKILDQQALTPEKAPKKAESKPAFKRSNVVAPIDEDAIKAPAEESDFKKRTRLKRENVKDTPQETFSSAPADSNEDFEISFEAPKAPVIDISSDLAPVKQMSYDEPVGEEREAFKPRKPNLNVKEFDGLIENTGVLEMMQEGYGFLRSADYNYLASPETTKRRRKIFCIIKSGICKRQNDR